MKPVHHVLRAREFADGTPALEHTRFNDPGHTPGAAYTANRKAT
jgi:hypothetical protein